MFAERGIEAVSLRDVSAAAGQRNHSAAQYHFGDRGGLVAAVYESRMRLVNEWRQSALDRLEEAGRLDDVAGLVAATVLPLVQLVTTTPCWYARFLARVRWDDFAAGVVADLPAAAAFRRTHRLLLQALLPLSLETRRSRVDQVVTLTVGTLAGWEAARHGARRRLGAAALADELLSTTVAVAGAPELTLTTTSTDSSRGGNRP